MSRSIVAIALTVLGCLWGSAAEARPTRRDAFSRTVALGATLGAGSPRGFGGVFVQLRPTRWVGLEVGAGLGGAFGPAVDATVLVSPFGTRRWAFELVGAFSHQIGWGVLPSSPDGRSLPEHTNWLSVGVASEWRPSRGMMFRIGAGRSFLLNTARFNVMNENELAYVSAEAPALPGVTPIDATRAAIRGEDLSVWYVHVDIAPLWRW
ncbi:MAG: hypothetical protein JNK72_13990 [Myxococcales bacterium]|nr:hypothetical protein [Myxococcales bacterium]